ncbi:MAG: hypothetical protein KIPDCIKN_04481 [Haliscomenobacter sp.]|nr:hypothetical protein [Haliscomenobacter sp.]
MKYIKFLFLSGIYILILILYLNNSANRFLIGIINDSLWINCLTVIYFLFLHYTLKTSLLPDKYYEIHEFEKSGTLYRLIGVKVFKIILTKSPLPTFTAKLNIKEYSFEGIKILEKKMRVAEKVHMESFLTTFIVMLLFGFIRDYRFFYFMAIFNIVINFYPVLVQRYNRTRIYKIQNSENVFNKN